MDKAQVEVVVLPWRLMMSESNKVIPLNRVRKNKVIHPTNQVKKSLEEVLKETIEKNAEVKRKLARKRLQDNLSVLESYKIKD